MLGVTVQTTENYERYVHLDPDEAKYSDVLFGEPILLLSGVTYRIFHKRLWDILSTGSITILYEIGYELGKDMMAEFKRRFKNTAKIFPVGIHHYFLLGAGKLEMNPIQLLRIAVTRSLTVKIKNNFPAVVLGETGQAECHISRGYLTGAAETLTGKKWTCVETRCLCKGDPNCEFKLKLLTKRAAQRPRAS